jgi:hypothetical protein
MTSSTRSPTLKPHARCVSSPTNAHENQSRKAARGSEFQLWSELCSALQHPDRSGAGRAPLDRVPRLVFYLRRGKRMFLFALLKGFTIPNPQPGTGRPGDEVGTAHFLCRGCGYILEASERKGFDPEVPRDTSWGDRYFHMAAPDGMRPRLRVRSSSLPTTAGTHPDRGEVCQDIYATLLDAGYHRGEVPGMKSDSGHVVGSQTILLTLASPFRRYSPVSGERRQSVSTGFAWAVLTSARL